MMRYDEKRVLGSGSFSRLGIGVHNLPIHPFANRCMHAFIDLPLKTHCITELHCTSLQFAVVVREHTHERDSNVRVFALHW